jgi:hypothetical protein
VYDVLYIRRAVSSSQLEEQWEDVLRLPFREEGAVQGAGAPQHTNVANYGIPYYPNLPTILSQRQDPTIPNISVRLAQGVPELVLLLLEILKQHYPEQYQVIFPVRANLPSLPLSPAGPFPVGEPRKRSLWLCSSGRWPPRTMP